MIRIVVNQKRCNFDFKKIVDYRANELINRGYIIKSIKYKHSKESKRFTGAVINYIPRL